MEWPVYTGRPPQRENGMRREYSGGLPKRKLGKVRFYNLFGNSGDLDAVKNLKEANNGMGAIEHNTGLDAEDVRTN